MAFPYAASLTSDDSHIKVEIDILFSAFKYRKNHVLWLSRKTKKITIFKTIKKMNPMKKVCYQTLQFG